MASKYPWSNLLIPIKHVKTHLEFSIKLDKKQKEPGYWAGQNSYRLRMLEVNCQQKFACVTSDAISASCKYSNNQ